MNMPDNAVDAYWAWMHKNKPGASPQVQAQLWDLWCKAWTGGRLQIQMELQSAAPESEVGA